MFLVFVNHFFNITINVKYTFKVIKTRKKVLRIVVYC